MIIVKNFGGPEAIPGRLFSPRERCSRMAKWMVAAKKADFEAIAGACGISPILARLIRNRDVVGEEETARYLNGTLNDLHDPLLLPDMEKAAAILLDKIRAGRKIRIIGDYDVDGICSSYILWRMLTFLGADADVRLPDRIVDGYGINIRLVEEAKSDSVDTILTCDNGIAAGAVLQTAVDAGMSVIVTDHHEIPFEEAEDGSGDKTYILPPADAIVEPKLTDPETGCIRYPFPDICGAQVTYKLSQVMLDRAFRDKPTSEMIEKERVMRELLGFAALATVCDVMPLKDEHRIFVREGLKEAANTENIGLDALIRVCSLSGAPLSVYHAGFIIGPCLNASGRLESAGKALELFMEKDPDKAVRIAHELKDLNDSRKSMTEQGTQRAQEAVEEKIRAAGGMLPLVLVIALEDCHESLAGIIAGRIREKYQRPTFVMTRTEEGDLKGSGRSVEGYDMYAEMNRCADLFLKFGGHKMAAGFLIPGENMEQLEQRLNENCPLKAEQMEDVIHIDMELPPRFVSMELTEEMAKLEPCGTANAKPVFVTRNIRLTLTGILGKNRNVARFTGTDETGRRFNFIYFRKEEEITDLTGGGGALCSLVYYPDINTWNGRSSLQFVIKDHRVISAL